MSALKTLALVVLAVILGSVRDPRTTRLIPVAYAAAGSTV
jgi:hypothetical protein